VARRKAKVGSLLRNVPCCAKRICMVKISLLLYHESILLMRDASSRRHLKHSKEPFLGIAHYSRHLAHIFGVISMRN
jgi:hypothetical protein